MTSTTRLTCLCQPTAHAISLPAERQCSNRNTDANWPLAKPDPHFLVERCFARSHPQLRSQRTRQGLASAFIGQGLSIRRSSGEAWGGLTMAVSIDRPLESTVETNGTPYSFDEDPPDMPGLKKSNERFRLPHITDLFPDIVPKYSTFSTKSRYVIVNSIRTLVSGIKASTLWSLIVVDLGVRLTISPQFEGFINPWGWKKLSLLSQPAKHSIYVPLEYYPKFYLHFGWSLLLNGFEDRSLYTHIMICFED